MARIADTLANTAAEDSAGTAPGQRNDSIGCCDTPINIVIGLFFDGTGNNQEVDNKLRGKDEEWHNNLKEQEQSRLQKAREAERAAAERETEVRTRLETAKQERTPLQQRVNVLNRDASDISGQTRSMDNKKIGGSPREYEAAYRALDDLRQRETAAWNAHKAAQIALEAKDAEIATLEAELKAATFERERIERERHSVEQSKGLASPVSNGPSNIAKLLELYPTDEPNFIFRRYFEGVGTFNEAKSPKEYTIFGQGFGIGEQGGQARIEKAKADVLEILKGVRPCKPESVTFDIFGFSRGAALARHFVNVILAGVPDFTQPKEEHTSGVYEPFGNLLREMTEEMVPDVNNRGNPRAMTKTYVYKPLDDGIVTIRFVGLFDTVGSFYWGGNDDDGEFVLTLPSGCAEKVVHLVSRDERRKNFQGTSIFDSKETTEKDGWKEIPLGGVHSDIGGGYPILMRSYHLMDYSDKFMDIGLPSCGQKEKEILLARAKMEKDIIAADGTLTEKYCLIKEFVEGTSDVVYCRWLLMRVKYTQDAYANYCLEIMRNEAVEKIKFRQVQGKDEVPSSLRILLPGANPAAEEQLWEHYFHVSAIDNDPIEKYSRQPLGYYLNDYFLAIGMCLDENPKDPRVMFPNTKSGN